MYDDLKAWPDFCDNFSRVTSEIELICVRVEVHFALLKLGADIKFDAEPYRLRQHQLPCVSLRFSALAGLVPPA